MQSFLVAAGFVVVIFPADPFISLESRRFTLLKQNDYNFRWVT